MSEEEEEEVAAGKRLVYISTSIALSMLLLQHFLVYYIGVKSTKLVSAVCLDQITHYTSL